MKLTEKQFKKIEHFIPIPRKRPTISNYNFMCALLYIEDDKTYSLAVKNGFIPVVPPKKNHKAPWE